MKIHLARTSALHLKWQCPFSEPSLVLTLRPESLTNVLRGPLISKHGARVKIVAGRPLMATFPFLSNDASSGPYAQA
jgi:hypothetical protein